MRSNIFPFFISMMLAFTSCSISGYKNISNKAESSLVKIHIFNNDFIKAIYSTNINIYNKKLTGITLIKKTDSAMRVVSMSELGIKYFDFEFPDDKRKKIIAHYVMKPLNKKLLINLIKRDLGLVFYLPASDDWQVMISDDKKEKKIIKSNKLVYYLSDDNAVLNISKQRILSSGKSIVLISGYKHSRPERIYFDNGKISINFVEIKY